MKVFKFPTATKPCGRDVEKTELSSNGGQPSLFHDLDGRMKSKNAEAKMTDMFIQTQETGETNQRNSFIAANLY